MKINFNVDPNKIQARQKQKAKTGISMQNVVAGALNLPQNSGGGQMQNPTKPNGWGANVQ